jgi:membrane protease YdiL (CAAX protease family)
MSEVAIRRPAIGPWTALLAFVVLWMAMLAIGPLFRSMVQPFFRIETPREIVAFRLAFGLPFTWLALGGTLLLLRWRGQSLSDLGWRRPAAIWGWVAGFAIVAFFLWGSFKSPSCRGMCFIDPKLWLTDWSLFRLLSSVAIGVTAGICEEISFRGFVMTQARDGGTPLPVQALLSGLTFGVAHIAIAGLSGRFDPTAAIGIVSSTTVFGIVFAVVYLLGRRSLTPVILAHGVFAFTTEPWMLLWGLGQTLHGH